MVIINFGNRILQTPDTSGHPDMYAKKYKGMWVTLKMFSHALEGNYTNFGIFNLYNDDALSTSMSVALRLSLAIPLSELTAYVKAMKPYFHFLVMATRGHMSLVMELCNESVVTLLQNLEEGLLAFEPDVVRHSCTTVDHIVTYVHTLLQGKPTPELERVRSVLSKMSVYFAKIMRQMFQLVMTTQFTVTNLCRPLLGLILLNQDHFLELKAQLLQTQIEERRGKLQGSFDCLMSGIEDTNTPENKDRFARNLHQFGQVMRMLA